MALQPRAEQTAFVELTSLVEVAVIGVIKLAIVITLGELLAKLSL